MNRNANSSPGAALHELARAWLSNDLAWQPRGVDPIEWWKLARRHGVDGLAGGLAAGGGFPCEELQARAMEVYSSNSIRGGQAAMLCAKIFQAAQREKIPISFVKGPALAGAYGDDAIRAFGDVDVLVPDGPAGRKLAGVCGLRVIRGLEDVANSCWKRTRHPGRVEAEAEHFTVEFTHGAEASIQPLHTMYSLWGEKYLLPPESGKGFPVPAPEAHLIFLLQHLGMHWLNRLIWLVDFAVLMRGKNFDADWLEFAARRLQMRKFLRAVTGFCRRRLDGSIAEMGQGPSGWKDGLYLAMLEPGNVASNSLQKYQGGPEAKWKDGVLGTFQHLFYTDLEHPSGSRKYAGPRWTGEWLRFFASPRRQAMDNLRIPIVPALFVVMMIWFWLIFRKTPRGFSRLARLTFANREVKTPCQKECAAA